MAFLLGMPKVVKRPKTRTLHIAKCVYIPKQMEPLPSWSDAQNQHLQTLLGDRGLKVIGWLRIDLDNVDVITADDEALQSSVARRHPMCLGGLVGAELDEVKYFKLGSEGPEFCRGADE